MRGKEEIRETIASGQAILGIELGSTRIKAVLIDVDKAPVASGSYDWENKYVDHIWTYDMEDIWAGLQGCYRDLVKNVKEEYGVKLTRFAAMGVSAMMHGYLALTKTMNSSCRAVHGGTRSPVRLRKSALSFLPTIFLSAGASHICTRRS